MVHFSINYLHKTPDSGEACAALTMYTRYMYNDDPLWQRGPHTRTSQVTKVTHTHTHTHTHSYTRRPAKPGGSAYDGVGVAGRSLSGAARGQRALLEADDAVGDVRRVRVDRRHTDRREVV